jgi:hypothetical protein
MRLFTATVATLRTWGAAGQAGVGLLVAAGALHGGPTQLWLDQAEQAFQASAAQRLGAGSRTAAAPRPVTAAPENTLPEAALFDGRLDAVLDQAAKAGLRVGEVTLASAGPAARGLALSRLELSAQGDYAAARGFVQAALAADPALSLDHLRLARPQGDVTELRIHMTWTFHARAPGGVRP